MPVVMVDEGIVSVVSVTEWVVLVEVEGIVTETMMSVVAQQPCSA